MLDSKRSNAINIGLTVLPPPRTIKTAILNFDEYALNKEGIEVRKNSQCLQVCIFDIFLSLVARPDWSWKKEKRVHDVMSEC